jgi:hypothetical protein
MKNIHFKFFIIIISFLLVLKTPLFSNVPEEDVEKFVGRFNAPATLHEEYRKLNEDNELIHFYQTWSPEISFRDLSEDGYQAFVSEFQLFDRKASPTRKVFNLMFWSQLTGCPLVALSQSRQFFYNGLHIYSPQTAQNMAALPLEKFSVYPFEKGSTKIGIRHNGDNGTYVEKDITRDLRENAISYLYLNAQNTGVDQQNYNNNREKHYDNFGKSKISYEFIKEYILPLISIPYVDDVLTALRILPKSVVNLMRGKAVYLSTAEGVSLNAQETSHNSPVTTYLGLIPGVFLEHNKKPDDNNVSMTTRALVHEIGHLIDYTVLQRSLTKSIPFPYQFPQFHGLKPKREALFTKHPDYHEHPHNDLKKTHPGYMTNYAESSPAEDFAEHFTYFILFNKKFSDTAGDNKKGKKKSKKSDDTLRQKYDFMETLIHKTPTVTNSLAGN